MVSPPLRLRLSRKIFGEVLGSVFGVAMASASVPLVLVEGENSDGIMVEWGGGR
ncbi:hypothetical protein [Mycobacterium leprae]|uniref:hypothetical protein n=1 Tax=Mycobacterium leprae TaxID=1769 RepID=UPI0002E7855B|nr:hypothetical protein [Mycobacterium leprae]